MTTPRNRFGTHDCDPSLLGQMDQFVEALLKFRRLHVIRIPSERSIVPAPVDRIAIRMTEAAEAGSAGSSVRPLLEIPRVLEGGR
jgi:hypothetical protein